MTEPARSTTAERPTLVRFRKSAVLHIASDSDKAACCSEPAVACCGLRKVPAMVIFADCATRSEIDSVCSTCLRRWDS